MPVTASLALIQVKLGMPEPIRYIDDGEAMSATPAMSGSCINPCKPWRRRAVSAAAGALFGSVSLCVLGQQSEVPVVPIEKVLVTGSNIPRVEGETGLPLQTITREEIINGGVQTVQELLERISANQSFGSFNEAKGEGNVLVGFTAASLRGLGYQRTLVLLNGRRVAPYALSGGQSVDLSGIPISAIDRVEVLKDGASAVYGTDAVGGVINFILRKDYQGAEANASYLATEQGGGNSGRINATAGFGSLATDKYNVFVSADYSKQDALKAAQRDSTKSAYIPSLAVDRTSGQSVPANIFQPGGFTGTFNPTIPLTGPTSDSCQRPYSFPTIQSGQRTCRFDFAAVIETIPETEKINVIGRLTWQVNSDNQFFAEGSYYHGKFIGRISPTPVSTSFTNTPMTLPPTSPYYPAAFIAALPGGDPTLPIDVNYRTVELGPRTDEAKVDQWRGVVGSQGTIKGWDYELAANYTANREVDSFTSGYVDETTFGPLLRSGVINPFGPNTDSVLEQMRATQIKGQANDNRASNYGGDLKLASTVYELPAGPLAVGLGLEGRRESLEQTNSDAVVNGNVIAGAGAVPSLSPVHRTVWSVFGELNIPVVKSLEVNLATRYDHYSDFGSATNPKITLRWQPAREVLVRAAYGTGFRVPTLSDLFQPQSLFDTSVTFEDPIRCPVTNSPADCQADIFGRSGGNPSLQPEKSQQVSAGFVVEPVNGLSASVDYYWVRIRNVIDIVPEDVILGDYARWAPAYIVRKPPDAQHPNLPGEIAYVVQYSTNVGTLQTSGIDIDVRWRPPTTPIGKFSVALTGTYVLDYKHGGFESVFVPPSVGARGPDGAISRWRHYAQLNWAYGAWGATLTQTFQDGYREVDLTTCADPSNEAGCTGTRRVGSYSIWDLQERYAGFKNLTLTLGIRNLMNTPPPVSNQGSLSGDFQTGIDPTYADPRGRMYYAAVRYAFK
jgi:iron complex outermembrane receptor protein